MSTKERDPQNTQLKSQINDLLEVINLGKEQGYLTYSQINDLLPEFVDTEHFDVIISMLEKQIGIKVFEKPPTEEQLLLLNTIEEAPDDVEEAASVLASVDKETGRTTDPVRMYMREMGTVELLTREGEIRIARRIEEGIRHILSTISRYPQIVQFITKQFDQMEPNEARINDIISGFTDEDEVVTAPPRPPPSPPSSPCPCPFPCHR